MSNKIWSEEDLRQYAIVNKRLENYEEPPSNTSQTQNKQQKNIGPFNKKQYLQTASNRFKSSYADMIMCYKTNEEEFQAMKYYEKLQYNPRYWKKGKKLKDKQEEVLKKYPSITLQRLIQIWYTRLSYYNKATKILLETLKEMKNVR